MSVELSSDDMGESLNQSTESGGPARITTSISSWDVGNDVNGFIVSFSFVEVLSDELELMVRVGWVFEQIEVQVITSLGINSNNSQVLGGVVLSIETSGKELVMGFLSEPASPDRRELFSKPRGGVINVVENVDRVGFVVTLDGVNVEIRISIDKVLIESLGDEEGLVGLVGGGLVEDIVSNVVTSPDDNVNVEVAVNELDKLVNSSQGDIAGLGIRGSPVLGIGRSVGSRA
jgi:hypothetical protein